MKKMQGSGNRPSLRGRSGAVYANFFLSFFAFTGGAVLA